MIIDYHTHHRRCGHAVGSIEDYIQRGMEIGVYQLGISDHMPLFHIKSSTRCNDLAMQKEDLPRYVEEVLHLREKYKGDVELLLGLEADYVEGGEEEIQRLLGEHPWDYVIGSVHYLESWDLFDSRQRHRWEECQAYDVFKAYYHAIGQAACSGLFDIIGHLDGIKRNAPERIPEEREMQQQALDAIAQAGLAVEVNTSGLRKAAVGLYPSEGVLLGCAARSIPVTVGSDAHHPRHVGAGYDEAAAMALQCGLEHWAVFKRRQRSLLPIKRLVPLV